MTVFQPIWVSTDEHLKTFNSIYSIYENTPALEKAFGVIHFPPKFPHALMYWGVFPFRKVPVVAIATGIVKIDNAHFSFQSKPFHTFGSITKNLLELEFDITANEINGVSRALTKSPINPYYSIPFTRVQTKRDGLLNDFLVCVSGSGPSMEKINAQSAELLRNLETMILAN